MREIAAMARTCVVKKIISAGQEFGGIISETQRRHVAQISTPIYVPAGTGGPIRWDGRAELARRPDGLGTFIPLFSKK